MKDVVEKIMLGSGSQEGGKAHRSIVLESVGVTMAFLLFCVGGVNLDFDSGCEHARMDRMEVECPKCKNKFPVKSEAHAKAGRVRASQWTTEQRSQAMKKAWVTRREKAALASTIPEQE